MILLDEILVTPGSIDDEKCDHPLSEDPTSKWNTFFKDNQALTQIDKDVRYSYNVFSLMSV